MENRLSAGWITVFILLFDTITNGPNDTIDIIITAIAAIAACLTIDYIIKKIEQHRIKKQETERELYEKLKSKFEGENQCN